MLSKHLWEAVEHSKAQKETHIDVTASSWVCGASNVDAHNVGYLIPKGKIQGMGFTLTSDNVSNLVSLGHLS